jgi:hypothetical protein
MTDYSKWTNDELVAEMEKIRAVLTHRLGATEYHGFSFIENGVPMTWDPVNDKWSPTDYTALQGMKRG